VLIALSRDFAVTDMTRSCESTGNSFATIGKEY
jgi:hypothetical protein